jgi:hypothetical protein
MAPRVWITETDPVNGSKFRRLVPIFIRYDRLMNLIENDSSDRMRRYKEKLFGTDTEVSTGDKYNLFSMLKELQITIQEWEEMTIHQQESTRAHYQLSGIVSLIRRHDELQRENLKKLEDKANAKK